MDGRIDELSQIILQYVFMIKFTLKQICLLINIKNIYNIQIIAIDLEIIYLLRKLFLHKDITNGTCVGGMKWREANGVLCDRRITHLS